MSEPIIQFPHETLIGSAITDCKWRLRTFVERDAYAPYDYWGGYSRTPMDTICDFHIYAINNSMRARSSRKAWANFVDKPLPELSSIPFDLDLIDGSDQAVEAALAMLRQLVKRITAVDGLTEMATSKVLYLLRPNFVAIADEYLRSFLRIWRGEPSDTFIRVQRAIRELGADNRESLSELHSFANSIAPVVGRLKPVVGDTVPIRLSKARILDILIWTEIAIHGPTPHSEWSRWFADEIIGR